jgi:hypothetical protein
MAEDSVKTFLENASNGNYGHCHNFYDWFCKETSLPKRAARLTRKLRRIVKSPKINVETMYVFFKNNCPVQGKLYDDFRICDMKTGDIIYTIVPKEGYTSSNGLGSVWGHNTEGAFVELFRGTWKEIVKWFNT